MLIKKPRLAGIENQPTRPMQLAELSPAKEPVTGPLLASLQAPTKRPAATLLVMKQCNNCNHIEPVAANYCGSCGLQLMF